MHHHRDTDQSQTIYQQNPSLTACELTATVRDRRVQKHPFKSILIVMPLAGGQIGLGRHHVSSYPDGVASTRRPAITQYNSLLHLLNMMVPRQGNSAPAASLANIGGAACI